MHPPTNPTRAAAVALALSGTLLAQEPPMLAPTITRYDAANTSTFSQGSHVGC